MLLTIMLLPLLIWGAYLDNVPTTVVEPDGRVLNLLASGDEYANRLHDDDGFTIIQSRVDGFYYYATVENGEPVPSNYRVLSANPQSLGIQRGIMISPQAYQAKKDFMQSKDTRSNRAPSSGTVNNLNVFIRFSDQTEFELPRSVYDAKFNYVGEGAYSLRDYFQRVSYGALDYVTHHYPECAMETSLSYQDPYPRSYYMPYNAITNPNGYVDSGDRAYREQGMLANAIAAIASQVPSSLNIDADNDGYVDNVCFVVRGPHTAWADLLWAHRWVLYYQDAFINGKQVWDYTFQPENHNEVRVLCHEMFHSVGAPDLYHYGFDGITPVGCWDIMESGWGHMGAHMKYKYGQWISNIPVLQTSGYYTLNPLTSAQDNVYRINANGVNNEYFILEYRKRGSDAYEQFLPGSGLLIYRIRPTLDGNADGPPDEVYIYRPNGNSSSNGRIYEAAYNAQCHRTDFNNWTNPNCFLSNGNLAGINISDISLAGDTISFFYENNANLVAPQIQIQVPSSGSVIPRGNITFAANVSHPNEALALVQFKVDGEVVGSDESSPYTFVWDASAASLGWHQLVVEASTISGRTTSASADFRLIQPMDLNWFGWVTSEPELIEFGRGVIPIQVAVDLNLGTTPYYVRKIAFRIEDNPWGNPSTPGLVSAKINRFSQGSITDQTLLNIGEIYASTGIRYEHNVSDNTLLSGNVAVILDLYEYQNMAFDALGINGHSWLTEPGRPWTDALARGVVGAAMIELELQASGSEETENLVISPLTKMTAYPNPFNPQINIKFYLAKSEAVKLAIFNLKGQLVKELIDGQISAGIIERSWDGSDIIGKPCSSGIYFIRLSNGTKTLQTKKIVLRK